MILIKIGGGSLINIEGVAEDIASLKDKCIVVHGANAARDKLALDLDKPKKVITSVSGYSSVFSDENAIDIIMMSYAGIKNKRIVEQLQLKGVNALGLSGMDGRVIQGCRNKGIRIKENGKVMIARDFSGKPKAVNKGLLQLLVDNGYVPVLCIPIIDENSFAINSENDDIINVLQQEFKAEKIIQLIEAPGFLGNKEDEGSLVKNISKEELEGIEAKVEGRMKRKILALRKLFENGAAEVIMSDGRSEHPVKDALEGKGTIIH
ncbi:acetylglutamate kinase [Candidatus Woesearchaeota archaeon]|nr:acetylglutamate kinase [Candidatus Woesearchaeota archaeon]|tara:strand:+ start:391 stop:1182 length:792 start_codon:yes stop_codon:yes gene_type:complete